MNKLTCAIVAVAIVAMAVPISADEPASIREENRQFLIEQAGEDWDPDAMVDVRVNGVWYEMTAEEAVDTVVDLHEDVRFDQAHDEHDPANAYAGTIHLVNTIQCADVERADVSPLPAGDWHENLQTYDGETLYVEEVPEFTNFNAVTLEDTGRADGMTALGDGVETCVDGWLLTFWNMDYAGVLA